jgi:hypothetical protein
MSVSSEDLFELIDKIRYDLTAAQGKITDLKLMLGDLSQQLPERGPRLECPRCGVSKPNEEQLADHLALVHQLVHPAGGS